MNFEIGRDTVLHALKGRAPRAMHLMEVVQAIEAPKESRDVVRDVLLELIGLGMAREMPGNRFRLADAPKKAGAAPPEATRSRGVELEGGTYGWLAVNPRGFGFVSTEDGEPDIFIPGGAMANALHGDRVRVDARPSTKGREGTVLEVIRRGVKRVAGVLRERGEERWLETSDRRVPARVDVVGTVPLGVNEGDEVVALIEAWPKYEGDPMQARVLATLGMRGSAAVELRKIQIREGIEDEFDEDVLEEAQALGTRVPEAEVARREDLRDLDLCTIDPPLARDHDDAVWAERLADGGYRVIVAIADVSHYVTEGSALDRAALSRATSIYLPERVIPMLPHELSSNLASLVPDEDRLVLAVEVHLAPDGAIQRYRFLEGVMRSRARLHYGGVARALHLSEEATPQHEAELRRDLLHVLWDVSQLLRVRRTRRGALDFVLPEAEVVLGEDGEPIDVRRSRTDPGLRKTYGMIEDLMLLANEVVAGDLSKRGIPAIYRVHGRPDAQRIEVFGELAESLGYSLGEDAGRHPGELAEFLRRIAGTDHAQALNFLLLRSMQQAIYTTNNVGHFALAAQDYLHFTSPIRRYPDLTMHRVVRAIARGEAPDREELQVKLRTQAAISSRLERRAMLVDREATNLYRAILVKDRVGESFDATITGVAEHGLYVTFEEPFVEARVPIDTLGDDWYELDALGLRLVGQRSGHAFALGDRITVRIENVSVEAREIAVLIVGTLPSDREIVSRRDGNRRTHVSRERAPSEKHRSAETGARRGPPKKSGASDRGVNARSASDRSASDRGANDRGANDRGASDRGRGASARGTEGATQRGATKGSTRRSTSDGGAWRGAGERGAAKSGATQRDAPRDASGGDWRDAAKSGAGSTRRGTTDRSNPERSSPDRSNPERGAGGGDWRDAAKSGAAKGSTRRGTTDRSAGGGDWRGAAKSGATKGPARRATTDRGASEWRDDRAPSDGADRRGPSARGATKSGPTKGPARRATSDRSTGEWRDDRGPSDGDRRGPSPRGATKSGPTKGPARRATTDRSAGEWRDDRGPSDGAERRGPSARGATKSGPTKGRRTTTDRSTGDWRDTADRGPAESGAKRTASATKSGARSGGATKSGGARSGGARSGGASGPGAKRTGGATKSGAARSGAKPGGKRTGGASKKAGPRKAR